MKVKIKSFIVQQRGAATILEYTIVLPLVMAIVFALIFVGYVQHQKALLESAVSRGAIYAQRISQDPNFIRIESDDRVRNSDLINEPYRYLFRKSAPMPSVEKFVVDIIENNRIFKDTIPVVTVEEKAGITRKITVSAAQDYNVPVILPGLELPPVISISAESTVYVIQPAEFIRNTDLAVEIAESVSATITTIFGPLFEKIKIFTDKLF